MVKLFNRVITASALFLCIACTSVKTSDNGISSIPSVSIDKNVAIKNPPHYLGTASNFGVNWGYVGAAIAKSDQRKAQSLDDFLKQCEIDIRDITYTQFQHSITSTIFKDKVQEVTPNQFQLIIERYGLEKIAGFGDNMRPGIKIKVILLREDKSIVWSKSASVGSMTDELPHMKMKDWASNPESLKMAFQQAVNITITRIMTPLKSPSSSPSN